MPGTDYTLVVTMKGTTVSLTVNGQIAVSLAYNGPVVDGSFGLYTQNGTVSADSTRTRANDAAFSAPAQALTLDPQGQATVASQAQLTASSLPALIDDAKAFWTAELGPGDSRLAGLDQVTVALADLDGLIVGHTQGTVVLLDPTAAGYGWFLEGALNGRVDLLTVVRHEFGHAIGFEHEDAGEHAIMGDTITLRTPAPGETASASPGGGPGSNDGASASGGTTAAVGTTTSSTAGESIQLWTTDRPTAGPNASSSIAPEGSASMTDARGPPGANLVILAEADFVPRSVSPNVGGGLPGGVVSVSWAADNFGSASVPAGSGVSSHDVDANMENPLQAKLRAAQAAINRGDYSAAWGQLNAFISQVSAQAGHKITAAYAALLIGWRPGSGTLAGSMTADRLSLLNLRRRSTALALAALGA